METWGHGPATILCLHGFPDSAASFAPLAKQLTALGYQGVAPYLPGYHPSLPDTSITFTRLVEHVEVIAKALPQPPIIVGHDWGSVIVQLAAAALPNACKAFISLGLPPLELMRPRLSMLWKLRHFIWYQMPWLPARQLCRKPEKVIAKYFRRWSPQWEFSQSDVLQSASCFPSQHHAATVARYYRLALGFPWRRDIRYARKLIKTQISMPSLYIAAEQEGLFTSPLTRHIEATDNATFASLNTGHFIHHEAPRALAATIARNVQDLSTATLSA